MHTIGAIAFNKNTGEEIIIVELTEVWGFLSYTVYGKTTNKVYKLNTDQIVNVPYTQDKNESYLRYIMLLAKIKNEISSGILSNLSKGIIPLPHQLHVLNRAISNNNVRYILADEVGLGKTIEAGLIIKELKTRGLIKRILIVCPTGLVTQWKQEMIDKFNEKFDIILPEDFNTIRKLTDCEDVYSNFDQVITPMDSIKPLERRVGWSQEKIAKYNEERIFSIINSGWDLVIIDEAHRVAGSSGEVARYKLGNLLAAASPYLLLLTATPHNGKTEPFLRLIRLIDEKAFPNFKAIVKEQVAPYVIRTEKREAIDNNGNKLFKDRITKVIELHWDLRHSLQRELYDGVTTYVSKNYNKAMRNRGKNMWYVFLLIMLQRLVTSSTSAIRESLERRIKVLEEQNFQYQNMSEEEFSQLELEEGMEEAIAAISFDIRDEINQLTQLIAVAKQAEFQCADVKVEALHNIIDELYYEDKNRKVIIFTEFVATQNYLDRLLKLKGYSISLLNGSMSIEERNFVLKEFKNVTNILISTDAGGEGLNLQFSNCVINYDLPWNPMKIEQRIGRVDRIGQQKDVLVFNFVLSDTIENRVKNVLEEKLSIILQEAGIDKYSEVIDSEIAELNYTDAYMNSIRYPKDIETNIKPVETEFKQQIMNSLQVKELIKEEKDLTPLIGKASNFELDTALKNMVTYYENYKGNPYLAVENYGINEPIITQHLSKEFECSFYNSPVSIKINNFPNEKGFYMLWQLSLSSDVQTRRIIPLFINDELILRPIAGQRIWEALLDCKTELTVSKAALLDENIKIQIKKLSETYAYDTFLKMKAQYESKVEETYKKQLYALNIRKEAAEKIGITNIRQHKLNSLFKEKTEIEEKYIIDKQIYPEFKLIFIACME